MSTSRSWTWHFAYPISWRAGSPKDYHDNFGGKVWDEQDLFASWNGPETGMEAHGVHKGGSKLTCLCNALGL